LTACSEEKKREAARLAAQLNGDSIAFADSMAAIDKAQADSMLADSSHEEIASTQDSTRPAVDSPIVQNQSVPISSQTETPSIATQETNQPKDSIIPDINAVPTENGKTPPRTMPRYVEDAYTVQVASSNDQAFSQAIVDTFLARGYDAYLGTVTRDGITYYRVRVGRYSSPTQANQTAVEINTKYDLQSWVDKITK